MLVEEEGSTYRADNDGDSDAARTLRPLQVAACTCRIAFGPRAGRKVLTVLGAMPREKAFKQSRCADIDGFSLHAAVRRRADGRQALEQLCRYITLPDTGQRARAADLLAKLNAFERYSLEWESTNIKDAAMHGMTYIASGHCREFFEEVLRRLMAHESIAEPKAPVATTQASTVGPSNKNSPHARACGL